MYQRPGAALQHRRAKGLRAAQVAGQVDVEHPLPRRDIDRVQRAGAKEGGVVHQHRRLTKRGRHSGGGIGDGGGIGHIAGHGQSADFLGCGADGLGVQVEQGNPGAGLHEGRCDGLADAAACAGDNNRLVLKSKPAHAEIPARCRPVI